MLPPWATITPCAPPSGTSTSAVTACDLFLMLTTEFSVRRPMPPNSSCRSPRTSVGRPATSGMKRSAVPVVERQHVVLRRLDQEQPLQLVRASPAARPRGRAPASSRCWCRRAPRRRRRTTASPWPTSSHGVGASSPRSSPGGRCRGCRTSRSTASSWRSAAPASSKAYAMLTPCSGVCMTPSTNCRLRQAGGLEHRRCDVDHVRELVAELALGLDPARPVHDRAVAGAAPVRGDLLRPLVRRAQRVRPADGVVVVGVRPAELVDAARS